MSSAYNIPDVIRYYASRCDLTSHEIALTMMISDSAYYKRMNAPKTFRYGELEAFASKVKAPVAWLDMPLKGGE